MARLGRNGFVAIAVLFHLIYIVSIFDIYFVSPVVHGMQAFHAEGTKAPAKRLVLFVGDGLRADKAFQSFPDPSPPDSTDPAALEPRPLAPFLRSRVLTEGTFGVSHTRVPTESRPGHVALIAGLYEDVSAVTTGWKLNPVHFDSVFNRSRHTWSWGSPDILPMFKEGAVPGRVDADMYGAEAEDFTTDATFLDTWVFDRVKELFKGARENSTLDTELREEKNVFFLHLLGLDTTGHAYRPYSKEYLHNIKVVDQGVKEITKLIEDFFGDDQTAFVFTADHGMSDWGSHGDGHPDNTRTPLIAWGSGIAKPITTDSGAALGHDDGFSSDWGLSHVQRHDVAQADIAALLAYLAGLEYPVNSVGELPISYLSADTSTKARAMLANAREILEMYLTKEEHKRATELQFQPFKPFREPLTVPARLATISAQVDAGQYQEAITNSIEVIKLGLQGMRYLQTYDWLFLRTLVTLGYFGWIAFSLTTVVDMHAVQGQGTPSRTTTSTAAFTSIGVVLFSVLWARSSRWTYYLYAMFPVVFWEEVFARRHILSLGKKALLRQMTGRREWTQLAIDAGVFIIVLEALASSYTYREVYTVCYFIGSAWPALYGMEFVRQNQLLSASWAASCISLGLFTLLPAIKVESTNQILAGGMLMLAVGVLYLAYEKSLTAPSEASESKSRGVNGLSRTVLGCQIGLVALSMIVTHSSINSLQARQGLPLGTQIVGWFVFIASLILPFLHRFDPTSHYLHRLIVIFLTFAPTFIILTIQYEGLFYFAFCALLITWVRLEHRVNQWALKPVTNTANGSADKKTNKRANGAAKTPAQQAMTLKGTHRPVSLRDFRTGLFTLYILHSAFFSTGNISSISSFSLDAVYRLIPVFDPFSQSALLLFKILIPFFLLSCILNLINARLGLAPGALYGIVATLGEWGVIRFFWSVKDEGSWLEIGETITRFVIVSLLGVFVAGLEVGGRRVVRDVIFGDEDTSDATGMLNGISKALDEVDGPTPAGPEASDRIKMS